MFLYTLYLMKKAYYISDQTLRHPVVRDHHFEPQNEHLLNIFGGPLSGILRQA